MAGRRSPLKNVYELAALIPWWLSLILAVALCALDGAPRRQCGHGVLGRLALSGVSGNEWVVAGHRTIRPAQPGLGVCLG
jgi:hypothetical protein